MYAHISTHMRQIVKLSYTKQDCCLYLEQKKTRIVGPDLALFLENFFNNKSANRYYC